MTSLITCTVNNNNNNQQQQQQIRTSNEKLANGIQMGINYRLYAIERVNMITSVILHFFYIISHISFIYYFSNKLHAFY